MARKALVPSKCLGHTSTISLTGPEAASETYKKGAVLVAASGKLQEGGANPVGIVGVAEEPGENLASGSPKVRYVPALPNQMFEGSIDDNGDLGNGAIAAADLYAEYGVTEDAAGVWYIDKGKTTTLARFRILEFVDAVGTVNGRVRGVFTQDVTLYGVS